MTARHLGEPGRFEYELFVVHAEADAGAGDAVGRHTWTLAVQPSPDDSIAIAYTDPRISADGTR